MSYYLIQKTVCGVLIPNVSTIMRHETTASVFIMCNNIQRELVNICIGDGIFSYADIIQFVNPYEYIFSPCPRTQAPVCSLKPKSNLYYELSEVFDLIDITIPNTNGFIKCDFPDDVINSVHQKYPTMVFHSNSQYGFVYHEIKYSMGRIHHDNELVTVLTTLLNSQSDNGVAIIKATFLFHRPVLDVVYILSSMYEKVYIVKPNTANALSNDKYIVCITKIPNTELNEMNYKTLLKNQQRLHSLVGHKLPLTFINRMNDINVIIGQRQLEYYDKALTIASSINKYELIHNIILKNTQKCAAFCEKMGLPYVKTNMFLDKR